MQCSNGYWSQQRSYRSYSHLTQTVHKGYLVVILVVRFLLDEFRSVISQYLPMSCEFLVVLSDVLVGICNGCLGQHWSVLLVIELVLYTMEGW